MSDLDSLMRATCASGGAFSGSCGLDAAARRGGVGGGVGDRPADSTTENPTENIVKNLRVLLFRMNSRGRVKWPSGAPTLSREEDSVASSLAARSD